MLGSEDAYLEFSGAAIPEGQAVAQPQEESQPSTSLDMPADGEAPKIVETSDMLYEVNAPSNAAGFSYKTDPVQKQFGTVEGIDYPCVYIQCSQEDLQLHRLNTLNVLAKSDADDVRYPLYIEVGESISGLGSIDSHSLKTLFTSALFKPWRVCMRVSKDEYYDDDMRLAFCS